MLVTMKTERLGYLKAAPAKMAQIANWMHCRIRFLPFELMIAKWEGMDQRLDGKFH